MGISVLFTWQGGGDRSSGGIFSHRVPDSPRRPGAGGCESDLCCTDAGNVGDKDFFPDSGCRRHGPVAVATILAFARAMGEFGATIMLAGNIPGKTQTMSVVPTRQCRAVTAVWPITG